MHRASLTPLLCVLLALPAYAQPAPPTGGAPADGPLVAGVCLLSQQTVFTNSKVGGVAAGRLKQLAQQIQAKIDASRAPLEADAKAFEAQRAHLSAAELTQRQQSLNARVQALKTDASNGSRQIERTREVVLQRIGREAQPVVAAAYSAHHCGLLLDKSIVLGGNMGGDLTPDVVRGLDARITTITFDLEPVPTAQPPAS